MGNLFFKKSYTLHFYKKKSELPLLEFTLYSFMLVFLQQGDHHS